jgi:hypothetical protein
VDNEDGSLHMIISLVLCSLHDVFADTRGNAWFPHCYDQTAIVRSVEAGPCKLIVFHLPRHHQSICRSASPVR